MVALGQKLIGEEWAEDSGSIDDGIVPYDLNTDEIEALGVSVSDPTQLIMPLFSAPIEVHILTSPDKCYPRLGFSPLYLTSASVPPYVRLHLLSHILVAMKSLDFIEPGEGFCMAVMRFLEGEWAKIEDNGRPDMSAVLKHFIVKPQMVVEEDAIEPSNSSNRRRRGPPRRDGRNDQQIKHEFEALCQSNKVKHTASNPIKLIMNCAESIQKCWQCDESSLRLPPRKTFCSNLNATESSLLLEKLVSASSFFS